MNLDILEGLKDFILFVAGTGILTRVAIEWNISRKEKKETSVNGNNNNGNGKGYYATIKDLMNHAIECPKGIHEKIEEYNRRLEQKLDENHYESMGTFTELKVSLAELKQKRLR